MNPVVFIPLTQGKVAIVDFDDFEKVRGLIGAFDSEEDAARAWDSAAIKLGFSEEALNFPPARTPDFEIL